VRVIGAEDAGPEIGPTDPTGAAAAVITVELSRKDDIINRLKVERDAQEIEIMFYLLIFRTALVEFASAAARLLRVHASTHAAAKRPPPCRRSRLARGGAHFRVWRPRFWRAGHGGRATPLLLRA
jgi:hypothetical protein